MIIAADIGNSNIVIGVFGKSGEPELVFRLPSDTSRTAEQLQHDISSRLGKFSSPRTIDGAVLSSVVPKLTAPVGAALKNLSGLPALIIDRSFDSGLNTGEYDRASLGSDRTVDMISAMALFPLPIAVFDLGTASTVSVLDKDGCFRGGLIMPGMRLSAHALSARAAQLPEISLDAPSAFLGLDAASCMQSGIIYGTAAQIDGLSERIDSLLGQKVTVVVTGGLAKTVIPYCKRSVYYEEHLLLKGLRLLFEREHGKRR